MKHIYPQSFKEMWKVPGLKMACISEHLPLNKSNCENCGGHGIMYTFIADSGPFKSAAIGNDVSKFAEGKWWVGKNYADTCPVCKGTGIETGYVEPPISMRQGIITNPLKIVKSEVEANDYTDI